MASKLCKIYWQSSIKIWFEKDVEKYRISYVLIVDFADPEIILAGECSKFRGVSDTFGRGVYDRTYVKLGG